MKAKEFAGRKSDFEPRINNPATLNVGGFDTIIFRTLQNRPANEDAIRGIR